MFSTTYTCRALLVVCLRRIRKLENFEKNLGEKFFFLARQIFLKSHFSTRAAAVPSSHDTSRGTQTVETHVRSHLPRAVILSPKGAAGGGYHETSNCVPGAAGSSFVFLQKRKRMSTAMLAAAALATTRAMARLGATSTAAAAAASAAGVRGGRSMSSLPPHMVRRPALAKQLSCPPRPPTHPTRAKEKRKKPTSSAQRSTVQINISPSWSKKKKNQTTRASLPVPHNTALLDDDGVARTTDDHLHPLSLSIAGAAHARAVAHDDAGQHRQVEGGRGGRCQRGRLDGEEALCVVSFPFRHPLSHKKATLLRGKHSCVASSLLVFFFWSHLVFASHARFRFTSSIVIHRRPFGPLFYSSVHSSVHSLVQSSNLLPFVSKQRLLWVKRVMETLRDG